jgi:hypothetical protein
MVLVSLELEAKLHVECIIHLRVDLKFMPYIVEYVVCLNAQTVVFGLQLLHSSPRGIKLVSQALVLPPDLLISQVELGHFEFGLGETALNLLEVLHDVLFDLMNLLHLTFEVVPSLFELDDTLSIGQGNSLEKELVV